MSHEMPRSLPQFSTKKEMFRETVEKMRPAVIAGVRLAMMVVFGVGPLSLSVVAYESTNEGCEEIENEYCNRSWMGVLDSKIANRPITQLVIPGSHDAGAISGVHCEGLLCGSAQNQDGTIYEQLERGSRYLDLRFAWNCDLEDYGTYHNKWPFSYRMRNILLDEIPRFVTANPKELLILNIRSYDGFVEAEPSWCRNDEAHTNEAVWKSRFADVCENFNSQLENEFLRPSSILRSAYIEHPIGTVNAGKHNWDITHESAATRAAISLWDPDSSAITLARSNIAYSSELPGVEAKKQSGMLAGTATMKDVWDLNGPQVITIWEACKNHLKENNIEINFGDWRTPNSDRTDQRDGNARSDGVFVPTDYSKYYVNWCNNEDNYMWNSVERSITGPPGLHRLAGVRNTYKGEAFGLYNVSLATTFVTNQCSLGPRAGFYEQEDVAGKLQTRFYEKTDGRMLRTQINIIEGDFIIGTEGDVRHSFIPDIAIQTNSWVGDKIGINLGVIGSGGDAIVNLECTGEFGTQGQLIQVPEPYARIPALDPLKWYSLLSPPSENEAYRWLTYPQFRVKPPVFTDSVTKKAQIELSSITETIGAPQADPAVFPGNELPGSAAFVFSGLRTETFIGTCSDQFGVSVRDVVSVDMPDEAPPTIELQACTYAVSPNVSQCTPYYAATWSNRNVYVHARCTDDSREGLICPETMVFGTGIHTPTNQFTASDIAGNSVSANFGGVWVDTVAPTVSFTLTNAAGGPYVRGNWSNTNVLAETNCYDALSGIQSCSTDELFTQDGEHHYSAEAWDNAGNTSKTNTGPIRVDKTHPTITPSATSGNAPYEAGQWTNQDVTVSFACNDGTSGVSSCSNPVSRTTENSQHSVTGSATDNAGNTSSATFSPIRIDLTRPNVSADATTSDGNMYQFGDWANQPVTVSYQCSDSLSGVEACPGPATKDDEGQHQAVGGTAHDRAGNSRSISELVSIDTTRPTLLATLTTEDGNEYQLGEWVSQSITVSYECDDQLSGVDSSNCPAPVTVDGEGGNQSVPAAVSDRAGNATTITVEPLQIDRSAPVVTYTPATATYSVLDRVIIDCTASDAISYVAEDTCVSIDVPSTDFEPGDHVLTASAVDAAGNIGTGTMSFLVTATHDDLCDLVRERMSSYPDTADDLCDELDKAADYEYQNKDEKHDERMRKFQDEVESGFLNGEITEMDADLFDRIAQHMIDLFTPDPSAQGRVHGSGHWVRTIDDGKVDFSLEAKFDDGELRGKLKLKDKDSANDYKATIDGDRITSLGTGEGIDCGGVILDGVDSFAVTAQGKFEQDDVESVAEFFACGIDNGKGDDEPADYFFVICTQGCSYSSSDRVVQGDIGGGNIHLHDAIITAGNRAAIPPGGHGSTGSGRKPLASSHTPASARKSSTDPENRTVAAEVDVITLDPILQDTAPAGSPLILVAVLELTNGFVASETVTLRWTTEAGESGEFTALTEALGVATFIVDVPEGDIDFVAQAGEIESNGVRVTGTTIQ